MKRVVVGMRKAKIGRCVGTSGVWASGSEWQGAQSVLRPNFGLNVQSHITDSRVDARAGWSRQVDGVGVLMSIMLTSRMGCCLLSAHCVELVVALGEGDPGGDRVGSAWARAMRRP
jgi:hypothetical protein